MRRGVRNIWLWCRTGVRPTSPPSPAIADLAGACTEESDTLSLTRSDAATGSLEERTAECGAEARRTASDKAASDVVVAVAVAVVDDDGSVLLLLLLSACSRIPSALLQLLFDSVLFL